MSTRQSLHDLQDAILDAVAPEGWRDMGITSATLELPAKRLPRLTLVIETGHFQGDPGQLRQMYELRPIDPPADPPALDLDAMADAALRRIVSDVSNLVIHARVQTACAFELAHRRSAARVDQAMKAHKDSLRNFHQLRMLRGLFGDWISESQIIDPHEAPGGAGGTSSVTWPPASSFISPWKYAISELEAPTQPEATKIKAFLKGNARRGSHLLGAIGACALITLTLGALGPALDAQPDRRGEWLQAEQELQQAGTLARWEAEARQRCSRIGSENSAFVQVDGGAIVCTDKHGRVLLAEGGAR